MNRTLTVLVCIMVAGVVVGASLPIFDSLTASSESVHNDGAGWVRFALDRNAGTTYTLSYTSDDDGFYIDNGTDRQTYDDSSTVNFDTILYADSNLSVWVDGAIHILGTNEGNPVYLEGSDSFTIVRDAEGVTISSEGTDLASFGVPTWAYIPVSTGNYGFFYAADFDSDLGNGVKNYPSDMPLAVVGGGNVGVYAYNDIYTYAGLGLYMHPVYDDDGLFYGAYWDTTAPEPVVDDLNIDDFNPDDVVFNPIDITPIDIDPLDPGMQIMSVPTPTYTDGDWGYDTTTVDGVTKAIIVSYSGAGGGVITVPATVGGYDVYQVGKGDSNNSPIMSSVSATGLVISEGIEVIGTSAFYYCSGISGPLTLPSTLTRIGDSGFNACSGLSGTLTIPNTVTSIGNAAFKGCNHFTGDIVIPDSVTTLGPSAFANDTRFDGTLTLSKNITVISDDAFYGCSSLIGSVIIPNGVTSIGARSFNGCRNITGPIVIPDSVTSIGVSVFDHSYTGKVKSLIIASNSTPANTTIFKTTSDAEVLDLSDIDYSTNRYGIDANATIYTTIGDCFGFISVVDVAGGGSGAVGTLIAILPLVMVVGLVLVAIGMVVWNRMM